MRDADYSVMADWTQEDTEVPGDNTHLWEESWDDDDTSEDFSAQLK
jgi:26 proteasome complex subunit DSS1